MNFQRNLGLGDGLVVVPAVQLLSEDDEIEFPSLTRDMATFDSIFAGNDAVTVYPAEDEDDIRAMGNGYKTGFLGGEPRPTESLDEWFYRQLGMTVDVRWDYCPIAAVASEYPQLPIPDEPYIFLHDDFERRITKIPATRFNHGSLDRCLVIRPRDPWDSILECYQQIKHADEVHCIPSSVKEFVSAVEEPEGHLFLHAYARPGLNKVRDMTKSRHKWTVIW